MSFAANFPTALAPTRLAGARAAGARRTALAAATLAYLIGPTIPALGPVGDVVSVTSVTLVGWAALRSALLGRPIATPRRVLPGLGYLLLALAAYSIAIVLLNGMEDTYFLVRGLRILVHFSGGVVLAGLYAELYGEHLGAPLLRTLFWGLSAHGALIVAQFLSPPLRQLVYSVTQPGIHPANLSYRMAGLTNGAGAGTSVIQFLPMLVAPMVWAVSPGATARAGIILAVCVNLVAFMATGRTGLLLALLFVPPTYLLWRRRRGSSDASRVLPAGPAPETGAARQPSRRSRAQTVLALALAAAPIGAAAWYVQRLIERSPLAAFLTRAAERTFETVLRFQERGVVKDETVDVLVDRYLFFPDTPGVFLFGHSLTLRTLVDSDIGYVQLVFGLGLVGTLLHVLFYLLVIRASWRLRAVVPMLALPGLAIAAALLFVTTKEQFLLTRYYFSATMLLLGGALHVAQRRRAARD